MGVKLAMTDPIDFFQKVLPSHVERVKKLIGAGVDVKLGFFSVAFLKGGKTLSNCSLPSATTTLINGTAPKASAMMVETGLIQTITEAYDAVFPGKLSSEGKDFVVTSHLEKDGIDYAPGDVINLLPEELSKLDGYVKSLEPKAAEPEVQPKAPKKPVVKKAVVAQPSNKKVALYDAQALLQPVRGTDEDSTYYAVALSNTIKVGARVKKTALSIRIEGDMTKADEIRASSAGFTKSSSGHMSVHVDCKAVPPMAVLGGMLFRLGTSFDQVVTNEKEFPHEG